MKVVPAIYRFPFVGWGWMRLGELAEILGYKPSDVLRRYSALSKDASKGVLATTSGRGIENDQISRLIVVAEYYESIGKTEPVEAIFVPAGWCEDVLRFWKQGFTRVVLEKRYSPWEQEEYGPGEWLNAIHITGQDDWYWVAVGFTESQ